jgi:hypothetical protein
VSATLPHHGDDRRPGRRPEPAELLAAALGYAERGWRVHPCAPCGKQPLTRSWTHDASTDPKLIRRWWGQVRHANIAVACGTPGPDVLDVDTKAGRTGLALFEQARRAGLLRGAAALVRTPSGGLHVWFAGSDQPGGAIGADKALELKARGGYVLLPPSFVVDRDHGYAGRYEVLEHRDSAATVDFPAIRRLLDPPPQPKTTPARPRDPNATRPGDDFNARATWADILTPHGWVDAGRRGQVGYWRRPGKTTGVSATTNACGTDRLRVFTTSTCFEATSYTKFGAYTLLNHHGDHHTAAEALRQAGYGTNDTGPAGTAG